MLPMPVMHRPTNGSPRRPSASRSRPSLPAPTTTATASSQVLRPKDLFGRSNLPAPTARSDLGALRRHQGRQARSAIEFSVAMWLINWCLSGWSRFPTTSRPRFTASIAGSGRQSRAARQRRQGRAAIAASHHAAAAAVASPARPPPPPPPPLLRRPAQCPSGMTPDEIANYNVNL
jgi:hypothetical protein